MINRKGARIIGFGLFASCGFLLAQSQLPPDPQQNSQAHGGWRRADEPPPPQVYPGPERPARTEPYYAERGQLDQFGSPVQDERRPPIQDERRPPIQDERRRTAEGPPQQQFSPPPPQLTIRPGTFVTVRINQPLSSDHNQPGDAFSATLVRPIVVDGVVVAQRGQIIAGRVAEAQRAGRVQGTSRLGIQLTELTLVDGQQLPIQSQLINRTGSTSVGRDVAAVAGTTGLGAAIGAASTWDRGVGAGIGAGAGAAVGLIGVLLTRGHSTVVYPEQVLTFRVEAPVTISTERAPQAFEYMDPREYERPYELQSRPEPPPQRPPYFYGGPAYPYYGPGPYYYGPSFSFFYGHRPGYFYGRGHYRRW